MTDAEPRVRSTWAATIKTLLGGAVLVSLVLLAFVWPTATSKVKDLPVAVVGSGAQAQAVTDKLQQTGAFGLTTQPDRAAAVAEVEERHSYGAIVLPAQPGGNVEVLTASAASPVVAQLLGQVAGQFTQAGAQQAAAAKQQAAQGAAEAGAQAAAAQAAYQTLLGVQQQSPDPQKQALQPAVDQAKSKADAATAAAQQAKAAVDAVPTPGVTVTDVVPLSKDDPRGAGLALAALPIAMGGMIGGLLISLMLVGPVQRLVALLGYSALGSLGMTAIMHWWFHLLPGAALGTCGAFAMALTATGATIIGLNALVGRAGIPIGAVLTMFIGNPLSSANAPLELMPWHWGQIGQFFVPGAAVTLLRNHSYFPKAALSQPLLVLGAWAVIGVVFMFVGHFRSQENVHVEGATEPDEPARVAEGTAA